MDTGTNLWLFIEFPGFTKELKNHFESDIAYSRFQSKLARNPTCGNAIPGCGGFRKIRWGDATRGKGKRGGLRIIFLQIPEVHVIVLVMIYGKNEQDNLSQSEKKTLASLAEELKKEILERFK